MSLPAESVIRRWNGKLKEATIWEHHAPDPELSAEDANCLIYISSSQAQREQPSFNIPFERLIWSQCQPLIKRAVIHETPSGNSPSAPIPPRSTKSQPSQLNCMLILQAPEECGSEEVTQYDITTRNFFAWLMEKPIVGPDPASALLALKIRMDVWRTSSVDNFATLDQYSKAQGYGDLGDVQTFLRNHLRGLTPLPTGYKLLDSEEHAHAAASGSRTSSFKGSILESAWWTQLRRSRPYSNPDNLLSPRNGSLSDTSDDGADADSQEMVMSGAIPPPKDIDNSSTTPYLPTSLEEQSMPTTPGAEQGLEASRARLSSKQLESSRRESARPRHHPRTWSLPNLHNAVSEEVPRPLYRQSSWLSNVCKEHVQLTTTRQNSATNRRAASSIMRDTSLRSSQRKSLSVPRHGRSRSHVRQPSPILEEDWMSPIRGRPLSSPVGSLHGMHNETSMIDYRHGDIEVVGTDLATEITPVMPGSASPTIAHTDPKPSSSTATRLCPHGIPPPQSIPVCRTCQKPKAPRRSGNPMRQQLTTGRGSSSRSSSTPASRTSVNLKGIASQADTYPLDTYLSDDRAECDSVISRFPSLRGRDQSTETLDTQSLQTSVRDTEDDSRSRRDSIVSELPVQDTLRPEKPADIFGGRFFVEEPVNTSPTRMKSGAGGQPMKSSTLIEAPKAPTDVPTPASLTRSTSSAQPRHSLRISCDLTEVQPCEPPLDRATSGRKDRRKTWPEKKGSIRAHRVPIDEQSAGAGSTKTMDSMLEEVVALEEDIAVPESPQYIIAPGGPQIWIERRFGPTPSTPDHGREQSKKLRKKRNKASLPLSSGLRMWSSKRLQKQAPSASEYQGLVLCMDRHGNFTALPSPAASFDDLSDVPDTSYNRSRTPLCELD